MANYRKIAEKFMARRVTFASPRPPEPTPHDEIRQLCRRYVPMWFVLIGVAITANCAVVLIPLLIVFAINLR